MSKQPLYESLTFIYVEQDGANFYFSQSKSALFEYGNAEDEIEAPFAVPDFDMNLAMFASSWFIDWCRKNNASPIWEENHHRHYTAKPIGTYAERKAA